MCGICGFVQFNNKIPGFDELQKMNNTLFHRGPDDEGYYLNENIGLAQRRLSILDLSPAGHQPMSNISGDIWVVFNGEIYNYLELQNELKLLGYTFKSRCDTEVIVYAYEAWKEKCFERFNGMFAIAIWDYKDKKLVLARDRLGKKPLYYYYREGNFSFASELKAIMKYPNFMKELDNLSMYRYFVFGYVPSPYAIFKNTFKVEAGHYMVLKDDKMEDYVYWDAIETVKKVKYKSISIKEAEEELEKLLKSSVEYRLISDVKLGAFLSGGIDSSIIVSKMAEINNKAVKTFTIGFHDQRFNEAEYARDIAKYLNTEHYEMYVKPEDCFEVITKLPEIYDEPFADSSSIPTYLISKMTKEYVTVALSGDGGDELFCGYNRYGLINKFKFLEYTPLAFIRIAFGMLEPFTRNRRHRNFIKCLKYGEIFKVYEHFMSNWRKEDLENLLFNRIKGESILSNTKFRNTYESVKTLPLLDCIMTTDIKNYLVDDILTKVDRASMANSLEARVPLLDYRIVEYALSLPLEYKYDGKTNKRILKNLLYKYIPRELVDRPKKGFEIPLSQWLRNELKYLVDNYLDQDKLKKQELFNGEIISVIIKEHMSGKENNMNMLWPLIMFQMWYERYKI